MSNYIPNYNKLEDTTTYIRDIFTGNIRNYIQPYISTVYSPSKITENIYISDISSSYNKKRLKEDGITHILTAILSVSPYYPNDFEYKNLPVRDYKMENMINYFDECYEYIESVIKSGGKILVHCAYGISRSATIIIAYLIRKNLWSYGVAYKYVKDRREIIDPNEGFVRQLKEYSNIYVGYDIEDISTEEDVSSSE